MKVIIVLVLLAAGACLALYYLGGAATFDPSQQGRDAKAAIKPGMTLKKVIAVAGEPAKYRVINRQVKTISGQEIEFFKPGAINPFDADRLTDRIAGNDLPHGFILNYTFSDTVSFAVTFDGTGTVVDVQDTTSIADVFQMNPD